MRKLLLHLDTSPHPSVFDRVVAFDAGADEVMSYGGVTEGDVRDLVHGAIFTRGPNDLHHTAIFIGGTDMAAGERILAAMKIHKRCVARLFEQNDLVLDVDAIAEIARDLVSPGSSG